MGLTVLGMCKCKCRSNICHWMNFTVSAQITQSKHQQLFLCIITQILEKLMAKQLAEISVLLLKMLTNQQNFLLVLVFYQRRSMVLIGFFLLGLIPIIINMLWLAADSQRLRLVMDVKRVVERITLVFGYFLEHKLHHNLKLIWL